jgi:serine/threonine-protein kinase
MPEMHAAGLRVTTEPAGASVREDAREVCAATPCDIVFKGDTDGSKTHKLVITRAGFKTETRTVKESDPVVHVKLVHGSGSGGRAVTSPTAKSDGASPSTTKDAP